MINSTKNPRVPLRVTAEKVALQFLTKFFNKHGYMPSTREIAEHCGKRSAEWGRLALLALAKDKFIKVGKNKVRAITILKK